MATTTTAKVTGVLKRNASAASLRTVGAQAVKATRAGLVAALSAKVAPGNKAVRKRIAEALESPLGDAMVGAALSVLMLPLCEYDSDGDPSNNAALVSDELRVAALANAGNRAADAATTMLGSLLGSEGVDALMTGVRVAVAGLGDAKEPAESEEIETKGVQRKKGSSS